MKKKSVLLMISILATLIAVSFGVSYAENVLIEADKQNFNGETNVTTFEGNVKANMNNITVKSPKASVKMGANGKPEEAVFVNGANAVKQENGTKNEIKAEIIRLSLLENKVKAEGNANSTVIENKKPVVTINADTQEYDMTTNVMTANGNVVINYDDLVTHSSKAKIIVDSEGKLRRVNLVGAAKIVQGKNILNAASFIFNPVTNELIASGSAYSQTTLDDLTKVSVWSDYQQYDKATKTMMSSGNVKISYKDYIAIGPKASFLTEGQSEKPNKILFYGRSKIQEGSRVVEANKIEITVNPKNFKAEGNVKTKFTQVQGLNKQQSKGSDKNKKSKKAKKSEKAREDKDKQTKLLEEKLNDEKPVNQVSPEINNASTQEPQIENKVKE